MEIEKIMSLRKWQIIHDIRSLLYYHELSGIKGYPQSHELSEFLRGGHPADIPQASPPEKRTEVAVAEVLPEDEPIKHDTTAILGEIADEVGKCCSCDLHRHRLLPVPGTGGSKVNFLVVGGWLTVSSSADTSGADVFGKDEDLMLLRMLDAINFPQQATFVTNVIKCGIAPSVQPKKENVETCASYLSRQIKVILPDVICSMGLIATRALLKNSKPLSQLRGRFHNYRVDKGKSIAVMPTYHPSFLLKNPEMKMATWNDLQLIEKRLKGKPH